MSVTGEETSCKPKGTRDGPVINRALLHQDVDDDEDDDEG